MKLTFYVYSSLSDSGGHHLKLFSQKPRLQQQDLVGTWKVFELSATPVFTDDNQEESGSTDGPPFIYDDGNPEEANTARDTDSFCR